MNREIKFKIWDTVEKTFLSLKDYQDLGAIEVENDGTLTLSPRYRFLTNMMIMPERFIPLQYIGLKDKNGKEVYEGDIINIKYQEFTVENAIVEYKCASFYGVINGSCFKLSNCCAIEVIGNVYDNKEQLEKEMENDN